MAREVDFASKKTDKSNEEMNEHLHPSVDNFSMDYVGCFPINNGIPLLSHRNQLHTPERFQTLADLDSAFIVLSPSGWLSCISILIVFSCGSVTAFWIRVAIEKPSKERSRSIVKWHGN